MANDQEHIKRKIDDLNERSGEVKDILGQAPNWVIQWGISVVFIIVIISVSYTHLTLPTTPYV